MEVEGGAWEVHGVGCGGAVRTRRIARVCETANS